MYIYIYTSSSTRIGTTVQGLVVHTTRRHSEAGGAEICGSGVVDGARTQRGGLESRALTPCVVEVGHTVALELAEDVADGFGELEHTPSIEPKTIETSYSTIAERARWLSWARVAQEQFKGRVVGGAHGAPKNTIFSAPNGCNGLKRTPNVEVRAIEASCGAIARWARQLS